MIDNSGSDAEMRGFEYTTGSLLMLLIGFGPAGRSALFVGFA